MVEKDIKYVCAAKHNGQSGSGLMICAGSSRMVMNPIQIIPESRINIIKNRLRVFFMTQI